jgi:hypothetical protein
MKKVLVLTPLALAAIAGCAPKAERIQEGQWETIVQLTGIELPNAPPEQLAQLRRQMNVDQPQPAECLSRAQTESYLRDLRGQIPPGCQTTEEVYGGGVLRTTVSCAAQAGRPAVMFKIEGTFTATTMNATITEEATPPNGQAPMRRSQRLRARRLGDCTPPPPAPPMQAMPPLPAAPPAAQTPSTQPPGAQPPAGL